ncbi:predicted protein [Lichtheimia corymbifera JMRC:FSU:9682]|uniref:Uncharacterized protein n=1 Tax=Lichtheimia corymbifera JMRC:FSU:9682 TaxID=1263082 RepID=A0A068RG87_9FUNG|nr:predicted protein [Lichtheimia corymbifera JMRC:FSU:9682]
MQWRSFVMLSVGMTVVLLVSLLADPPYPRPVQVYASNPVRMRRPQPNQVILSMTDDFLYQTLIWYEMPLAGASSNGVVHGIGPMKTGVVGVLQQRRKPLETLRSNRSTLVSDEWSVQFEHTLSGPISKISHAPPPPVPSDSNHRLQFAVMYHVLENEDAQHITRVYYFPEESNDVMEYKDLIMRGTTWIDWFNLEHTSILYSRDPDIYRFRIAPLPTKLNHPPHSISIPLDKMIPGEPVKRYHQPKFTQKHRVVFARIYSPANDTYRVFSADVHKTRDYYHVNITITDGNTTTNTWKQRDKSDIKPTKIYSEENVQYMAFVDGTHQLHHDRVETKMPQLSLTRSKDGKTLVVPFMKNQFLTVDYTDRVDVLKYDEEESPFLYRNTDKSILPEYYFWSYGDRLETASEYEIPVGAELDESGSLLAVWTDANVIHIFKREPEPHHRIVKHSWYLSMVVAPTQGELDAAGIGTITFYKHEKDTYMVVGLLNQEIRTYSMDQVEEVNGIQFLEFVRERWDMLIAMSFIILIFVINESHSSSL